MMNCLSMAKKKGAAITFSDALPLTFFPSKILRFCCLVVVGDLQYYIYIYFVFPKAAPAAYGDSQARGLIGAVGASVRQSHSNTGSELCL